VLEKIMKFSSIATVLLLVTLPVFAEEGGSGHYVTGSIATLIDLPPIKPGWVFESLYLHYEGDISATVTLPTSGLIVANLDATSDALSVGGLYTFETKVAGAFYSVGSFLPYVWMDVTANVTAGGFKGSRRDKEDGIGDITLLPLVMGWKNGDWQYNALLSIYAPTGDYEAGSLANPGLNRWSFDPTVGISYNGEKSGFNAALHTGFAMSTENADTDYKSGTAWHTELTLQQLLPVGPGHLGIGLNAFFYEQITADSGTGAKLGDFEGRSTGVGPVLTYVMPLGENTIIAEASWLPELDTKRRLEGDYFWLKLVYQF
jgi:hypothetical protein